jgi:hypothetical protein
MSRGQPTGGGPREWGLGEGLTAPHRKTTACYEMLQIIWDLAKPFDHGNKPPGSTKGGNFD